MKKIYLIGIVLFGVLLASYAFVNVYVSKDQKSKYKVLKVKGHIKFAKTNKDMKTGDNYATGMPVKFLEANSKASIIGGNVRFLLQEYSTGRVKILPAKSNVLTRSGALINILDLKSHFNGRYLIFDHEELQIGKEAYPMNETHFFFLRYMHNGERIDKRLDYKDNILIIDKDELFKIDGNKIRVEEKEMKLFYFDSEKKSSYQISSFTPVFPDLEMLKLEMEVLINEIDNLDSNRKKEEIIGYLNEFYGRPQVDNLSKWLKNEFGLIINEKINFK